jgi:hypothetical protein
MHGVSRGEARMTKDNLFGALDHGAGDSQHLIDDAEQAIKRRLNCIAAVDRNLAM